MIEGADCRLFGENVNILVKYFYGFRIKTTGLAVAASNAGAEIRVPGQFWFLKKG